MRKRTETQRAGRGWRQEAGKSPRRPHSHRLHYWCPGSCRSHSATSSGPALSLSSLIFKMGTIRGLPPGAAGMMTRKGENSEVGADYMFRNVLVSYCCCFSMQPSHQLSWRESKWKQIMKIIEETMFLGWFPTALWRPGRGEERSKHKRIIRRSSTLSCSKDWYSFFKNEKENERSIVPNMDRIELEVFSFRNKIKLRKLVILQEHFRVFYFRFTKWLHWAVGIYMTCRIILPWLKCSLFSHKCEYAASIL